MILQLRQMRFTDASTFMFNSPFLGIGHNLSLAELHQLRKDTLLGAENDARTTQVIRSQLNRNLVTGQYANVVHTHLPGNKAQHDMTIFELYPERCIGKVFDNLSLHFYQVFLRHPISPKNRSP